MTTALAEKYVRGFYEINRDMNLYVNTGIGNTKAPFRLFNVPQITVFYLKNKIKNSITDGVFIFWQRQQLLINEYNVHKL